MIQEACQQSQVDVLQVHKCPVPQKQGLENVQQ